MDSGISELKHFLDRSIFNNTLKDYALSLALLLGLVLLFTTGKRVLIVHLKAMAARTATDFDDFLVSLLSQIGPPTFIAVSLYAATLPLELEGGARQFVRLVFVIVLTFRAILIAQQII